MEHQINLERDFPQYCVYVDFLLASSLRTGRCAPILRNLMVAYAAGIRQRAGERNYLFEPEAVCQTIKLLEGRKTTDFTKGSFRYEKGPLAGLYKKHFFQANFLVENIKKEIEREGEGIIFRKLSDHYGRGNYKGKPLEDTDLSLILEALFKDTLERRAGRRVVDRDGGLTGEHLIYAAMPSGKIYLYASFHEEDHQRTAECVQVSLQDFPELTGVAPVFDSNPNS